MSGKSWKSSKSVHQRNPVKVRLISWHVVSWAFYTWFFHLIAAATATNGYAPWYNTAVKAFLSAYLFYTAAFLIFPFCLNRPMRRLSLLVVLPVSIGVNFLLRLFVIRDILPWLTNTPVPNDSIYQFFVFSINWWLQFTLYGLAYHLVFRTIKTERRLRETETANLRLENKALEAEKEKSEVQKQKIQAEYNYLKAQINPHFLFNTLAFIHNEVERHSAPAGESVALLGELMRYSLRNPEPDGLAPLEEEVRQLENYLQLLRLRHGRQAYIHYGKTGAAGSRRIPPHLLLTLAENAVKHGVINQEQHPVTISLHISAAQLAYRVRNRVQQRPTLQACAGMGLKNTADRLAAIYGPGQHLQYTKEDGFFEAGIYVNFTDE
jgi:two-component system, LytTR family, sensor kinase